MNDIILRRPVKRTFDMHRESFWGSNQIATREMVLKKGVAFFNLDNYPIDEIKEFFKTDYFSNSIDYMIALAIYEGATSIDLYGVNMTAATEWAYQKPGVDYWCGQAMGRGIEVNVYGMVSIIMKTCDGLLYGYLTKQETN